jgi:hydrogenase maturation protease
MTKALVAGIGNVFFRDDGFGVEVVRRLSAMPCPAGVRVMDVGIRAHFLAFELLDGGYDALILVDATRRGHPPGTVTVVEPDVSAGSPAGVALDGHSLGPEAVLHFLRAFGAVPPCVRLVGCEPESLDEGMDLSGPVSAAVDEALAVVREILAETIPCV